MLMRWLLAVSWMSLVLLLSPVVLSGCLVALSLLLLLLMTPRLMVT